MVHNPLGEWLPTRLDYFGEAAFVLSIVGYYMLKFWE
jgi:hypothetical protein